MSDAPTPEMKLRKWCYVQSPSMFDIAPCKCGNHETQWSEFEKHLWCNRCQKDFIPAHNGIFDGPIPVATCAMLGIRFDVFNLETQQVEPFFAEGA